jgi:hypothetical protein
MPVSSRLYHCCRCHCQVIVCSPCDRGQRYCPDQCRYLARFDSLKRSSKKYRVSRKGQFNNAARQRQFRLRNKQKVTHQGSPPKRLHDLLKTQLNRPKETQKTFLPCTTIRVLVNSNRTLSLENFHS